MSPINPPAANPAHDFAEACERFALLRAEDGPEISSAGHSRFFHHGKRTDRAVVLLHGFTNCPQQWEWFGRSLHAGGDTIVIPRLPGHGHAFRGTKALGSVSASDALATVGAAIDIAAGAGERVIVAGLSIGATMAAWHAMRRGDVDQAVAIVPFFAPRALDREGTRRLVRVLLALPGAFLPWDPGGDGSQIPSYGYPKFSTHMLAQCLRIADDVSEMAAARAPAGRVVFALNQNEPACNNAVSLDTRSAMERARAGSTRLDLWTDLPANHDVIDPTNPKQRVDLVYPRLRELIDSG